MAGDLVARPKGDALKGAPIPGAVVYVSCGCGRSWVVPKDAEVVCTACGSRRLRAHPGTMSYAGHGPLPKPNADDIWAATFRPADPSKDWTPTPPPPGAMAAARAALGPPRS